MKVLTFLFVSLLAMVGIPVAIAGSAHADATCVKTTVAGGQTFQRTCQYDPVSAPGGRFNGRIVWDFADSKVGAKTGEIVGNITNTSPGGDCMIAKSGHAATVDGAVTWDPIRANVCTQNTTSKTFDILFNYSDTHYFEQGYFFFDVCQPASNCVVIWRQWIPKKHDQ